MQPVDNWIVCFMILWFFVVQLYQLVKKKAATHEGDWAQEVLFFFLEHAYFQPVKTDLQVSIGNNVPFLQIRCSSFMSFNVVIYAYTSLFACESSEPVIIICSIV